jgi:hypothetical protein
MSLRLYVIEMGPGWQPMRDRVYLSNAEAKSALAECSSRNPDDAFRIRRYYGVPQTEFIELRRKAGDREEADK